MGKKIKYKARKFLKGEGCGKKDHDMMTKPSVRARSSRAVSNVPRKIKCSSERREWRL